MHERRRYRAPPPPRAGACYYDGEAGQTLATLIDSVAHAPERGSPVRAVDALSSGRSHCRVEPPENLPAYRSVPNASSQAWRLVW